MAHRGQKLVVVHRVTKRHDLVGADTAALKHLLQARGLGDALLHHVDPAAPRRCEHEDVAQLALEHIRHIHDVARRVAIHRRLDYGGLRVGNVTHHNSLAQVLVGLELKALRLIEQIAALLVKYCHMQAAEHVDDLLEALERHVREHLAVDKLACHHDLRTIGGHEVDAVCHGRKELSQRVEPAARRDREADARLVELPDEVERLRRHLRVLVEQRAVHIRSYQLDHTIYLPF